jgi:hypothetical protein
MDTIITEQPTKEIIEKKTKQMLLNDFQNESQVVIHCSFSASDKGDELIRIWRSTFLCSNQSSHRSKLSFVENVALAPDWTPVIASHTLHFTLIFTGLPKSCKSFDFKEEIVQTGGFFIPKIPRNKIDVYHIHIK